MKTNHRRGFVAKKHKKSLGWGTGDVGPFDTVGAGISFSFTNGNRGMAKAKRGARKFVHSRIRAQHKRLAKLAITGDVPDKARLD